MKFFSEFKPCWGGAVLSPATETSGEGNIHSHGHGTKVKSTGSKIMQWQPKLHVISEDKPMSEVTNKKRSVKVKPKSTAKAVPPPSHGDEYWKGSYTMALPAFSPTPFLF